MLSIKRGYSQTEIIKIKIEKERYFFYNHLEKIFPRCDQSSPFMSVREVGPPSKKLCSRSVGHSEEGCLFAGKTGSETPRPLASAAWEKRVNRINFGRIPL
jgi:hypothetical protein